MSEQEHPVDFQGTAGEYFGIWIVNVLLGIVTLGIYSAWAKVRNKKYFYGNTFIADNAFDYHATGWQILKGRLIVIAAILALTIVNFLSPILYLILYFLLLLLIPLIIIRALRFNARVSSYRNVRFNFDAGFWHAFAVFFLLPIANFFTLFLATPVVTREANRLSIKGHTYGDRKFHFNAGLGGYYKAFLIVFAMAIVLFIFILIPLFAIQINPSQFEGSIENNPASIYSYMIAAYAYIFLVLFVSFYYQALVRNIVFNNTVLDDRHSFTSNVNPFRYMWIILSNLVIIVLSIGLMTPWARVRMARYLASVTTVITTGSLDEYTSEVSETSGVISSEFVDMEGIDLGLGI